MIELGPEDYAHMRRVARRKALKLARGHDDIEQAAQDIEQDGWETFLLANRVHGDPAYCWLRAKSRMATKYYEFRCGSRCWLKHMPIQGLDLTPLESLDPSVEELVYGCEVMRQFDQEFKRQRKNDQCAQLFEALILNGGERFKRRAPRGDEPRRRQRIREMYRRLSN